MSNPVEHAPHVFLARYGRARGRLLWRNAGAEPFAPRSAQVHCPAVRGRSGERLHEARLSGTVSPRAEGQLRVQFRIDERTKPGVYDARLEVDGNTIPIVVAVPEDRSFNIMPDRLTIESDRPGAEEHVVVAQNRGNVPVTIDHPDAVRMEPDDRGCIVIRETLRKARTAPVMPLQDALVDAAAESMSADPILGVRIVGGPYELPPGETMALTIRLRVPELAEAAYSAALQISGAPFSVRVLRPGRGTATEAPRRSRSTK
jgi:hypothetical protein